MNKPLTDGDWTTLKAIRASYVGEKRAVSPFGDTHTLALYDQTFAERIGWKWDNILRELTAKGWQWPKNVGTVIDWGCGSGVASRRVLRWLTSAEDVSEQKRSFTLHLHDRSTVALAYARDSVAAATSNVVVKSWDKRVPIEPFALLVSHVLTELSESEVVELVELAQKASVLLWVEPGTSVCAGQLVAVREKLASQMSWVAPCPQQGTCGMVSAQKDGHWCHFFAKPDQAAFTTAFWREFGERLGIDLRSLPVSYLVGEKRSEGMAMATEGDSRGRVIGRSHGQKGYLDLLVCGPDGVGEQRVTKSKDKARFKQFERDEFSAPF